MMTSVIPPHLRSSMYRENNKNEHGRLKECWGEYILHNLDKKGARIAISGVEFDINCRKIINIHLRNTENTCF